MCYVYSSGSNAHGQLAHGSEVDSHCFKRCIFHEIDEKEFAGSKILSIATGANHTLLLLRSQEGVSQLWGCGNGERGQLGAQYSQESGASSVFRRIVARWDQTPNPEFTHCKIALVAASWETSFVVFSGSENDLLLSVGSDDFGDLGIGGLPEGKKETDIWRAVDFTHLLPKSVSNIRISQLKAGPHNILLKLLYSDANMREVEVIVGWGAARQGQLGQDPGSKKPLAIVNIPKALGFSSHISAFAVGSQHAIFLTSEGAVLPFGSNRKGQLSGLDAVKSICAVASTWNGTYLLKNDSAEKWTLLGAGNNSHGQLAHGSPFDAGSVRNGVQKVKLPPDASSAAFLRVICGSEHVLLAVQRSAQDNDGDLDIFAWGWNEHGNLGLGHTLDVDEPTRISVLPSIGHQLQGKVVGVWAGCATSWIVIEER